MHHIREEILCRAESDLSGVSIELGLVIVAQRATRKMVVASLGLNDQGRASMDPWKISRAYRELAGLSSRDAISAKDHKNGDAKSACECLDRL